LLDLRRNLHTARWLLFSTLLWVLALEGYPWIIATLSSPSETAAFGVALAIANALNVLIAGLHNYIGPTIAHVHHDHGRETLRREVYRFVGFSAVIVALPCLAIGLFRDGLIVLLYGDRYVESAAILVLLLIGLLANALSFPLTRLFFAFQRGDLDLWINGASLALFLPIGFVLVWLFGAFGAGLAVLLTQASAFLMRLWMSFRILRLAAS
jgi:O-antigen/teichoic acid export membrane protein